MWFDGECDGHPIREDRSSIRPWDIQIPEKKHWRLRVALLFDK